MRNDEPRRGRPREMRENNPQIMRCAFCDVTNTKCSITKENELICNKKHCSLFKTKAQHEADKKKYGWPFCKRKGYLL